eukprot:9476274-Pyramimonas_sp.AAC.1
MSVASDVVTLHRHSTSVGAALADNSVGVPPPRLYIAAVLIPFNSRDCTHTSVLSLLRVSATSGAVGPFAHHVAHAKHVVIPRPLLPAGDVAAALAAPLLLDHLAEGNVRAGRLRTPDMCGHRLCVKIYPVDKQTLRFVNVINIC